MRQAFIEFASNLEITNRQESLVSTRRANVVKVLNTPRAHAAGVADAALIDEVESLSQQVDQPNSESPSTPEWAYKKAQQDIEKGQGQTSYRAES